MCVCLQRGVGWLIGVVSLEKPSQLGLQTLHHTAPRCCAAALIHSQFSFVCVSVIHVSDLFFYRKLRVADQWCEEPLPPPLISDPSPVLRLLALLPGRRSPRPCSPPLWQDLHHLARRHLPTAQQSLLLPGSRPTEGLAPLVSARRPPALFGPAGKETSPLQGPLSSRVCWELPLPHPPPQPPQPSGAFPPAASLWHCRPLLLLPLQLPPEPPTRSYIPARQARRGHHRLSAAPVSMAPDHQPLPLTAGPHLQTLDHWEWEAKAYCNKMERAPSLCARL